MSAGVLMVAVGALVLSLAQSGDVRSTVPSCALEGSFAWCNTSLHVAQRVELLVAELTAEERVAQLSNDLFGGVPGVERLGLDSFNYIIEASHGLLLRDSMPHPTSFPQVIGMAATFNKSLFQAVGKATGLEGRFFRDRGLEWGQGANPVQGRSGGLLLQFNINVFRDPRWGRGQETPGECPTLSAAYAHGFVTGIQSPMAGAGSPPLAGASCKHFDVYSFEGGPTELNRTSFERHVVPNSPNVSRHNENAVVSPRDLAETYFPAFEACARSGALGAMCAYNQVNGVPSCANSDLLQDLMRDTWGFKGLIVTDCDAIADMYSLQQYRATPEENIEAALQAGTDVSCSPGFFKTYADRPELRGLVETAVKRALHVRFQLGEFDPPAATLPITDDWAVASSGHAALALEAALQGAVLLKNEGTGKLPWSAGLRLAVLGLLRSATRKLLGNYEAWPVEVASPLAGLRRFANVTLPGPEVSICGDASADNVPAKPDADAVVIVAGLQGDDPDSQDPDMRPLKSQLCRAGCLETEGCDRPNISWPQAQDQLIRTAAGWGLPVVLVVISGGPLDLSSFAKHDGISAILWMGYPGQAGGAAMASLIFGEQSPSGRLSQTFYSGEYLEHVPMQDYSLRPDADSGYPGRGYRFVEDQWVVYPFGYGLSYDSWRYEWASTANGSWENASQGDESVCRLGVRALLDGLPERAVRSSSASVLLFLRPPADGDAGNESSWPLKVLRHFDRVMLPPAHGNETRWADVSFELTRRDFELVGERGESSLVTGRWVVEVGQPADLMLGILISEDGCRILPGEEGDGFGGESSGGPNATVDSLSSANMHSYFSWLVQSVALASVHAAI